MSYVLPFCGLTPTRFARQLSCIASYATSPADKSHSKTEPQFGKAIF